MIIFSLKENAVNIDSLRLPGRISPLMLSKNLGNERISQMLVGLGCSVNIRDTWKLLTAADWGQVGKKGVYLPSIFYRPESDRADSLL